MSFPSLPGLEAVLLAQGLSLTSFLAPAIMLVIIMLVLRRGSNARRRPGRNPFVPPFAEERAKTSPPAELAQWTVEMHELVRDTKAEIDTKVAILRQTLLLAQEQEARLTALVARLERLQSANSVKDIDSLTAVEPIGTNLPGEIDEPGQAGGQSKSPDEREATVARLARGGYSDVYIANQVGATLTEIRHLLEGQRKSASPGQDAANWTG